MVAPYPPRNMTPYSSITIQEKAYFWCSNNIVFSSKDGGSSFTVYPPYAPVENVMLGCCTEQGIGFADSLIGYIADAAHGEFRTTDGGFTWTKIASPGSNINLVVFGSSIIGWKFGDGGTYRTTNAGQSWTFIGAPYWNGGIYSKAFALDENHVWLAKSYYSGRAIEGSIWRSENSGLAWTRLDSAPVSDSTKRVVYNDMRFNSSGLGIAIGTIKRDSGIIKSFISRTGDYGASWTTEEFLDEDPKTVLSIGDSIWLIFGGTSTSYVQRSVDSGKTWQFTTDIFPVRYSYSGTATYIPEHNTILVSTSAGLFKSSDFGVMFSRITGSMDVIITGISVDVKAEQLSQQLIFGKSYDGSFLRSEDGGRSWSRGSFASSSVYPFSQIRIAEGVIYSIPDQHSLYKSLDKGDTWQEVYVPVYSGLQALYAYDKDNVVIHAYQNLMYSSDGGNSWILTPFPSKYWLNESSIPAPGMVVSGGGFYDSSGTRGIIYRTTNAGYDWQIIDFPREINRLKMITPSTGFAISNYEVYKTTNGGRMWKKILSSTDYYTHYVDFFFDDSLRGLIRVSFEFMETRDGGNTWIKKDLGVPIYSLKDIVHLSQGSLFAVGDGMLWKLPSYTIPQSMAGDSIISRTISTDPLMLNIYPNPFNPSSTITFVLLKASYVTLNVYNSLGQLVASLVNEQKQPGRYDVQFDGSNLPSGVYFYRIVAGDFAETKKMVLIR